MNRRLYLRWLIVAALIALPALAFAQRGTQRILWRSKQDSRNGLYTTKNYFVSHGVGLNVSAMYYFGDVDNEGVAFTGGFNKENLSYGGGLQFAYNLPAGNHCNLRFGLMGGTIRGNNTAKFAALKDPRDDYRKFLSYMVQPSFGVQYYPFSNAGFYLFAGVAFNVSIISEFEFYYHKQTTGERAKVSGKTFGLLPMGQLGLGYTWRLTESWSMSAEILGEYGFIDTQYMNLDAWPLAGSQNDDGVELGNTFGTWQDREGKKHIHWNDGWFQVGLTVTYHWRNCERCRISNTYWNIKPARKR